MVAREAAPIAPSGPANDGKREQARYVAARALVVEARLLCGSARLLGVAGDDATRVDAAEKDATALDVQMDAKPAPAPIDAAARARLKCLESLTLARRAAERAPSGRPRPTCSSRSSRRAAGSIPSRDERGVVVTLRDAFDAKSAAIAPATQAKLADLGRVASSHAGVGVQVVVHDATIPSKTDAALDAQRAAAVVQALVAAGAPKDRVHGETAGARSPIVDPNARPTARGTPGSKSSSSRVEARIERLVVLTERAARVTNGSHARRDVHRDGRGVSSESEDVSVGRARRPVRSTTRPVEATGRSMKTTRRLVPSSWTFDAIDRTFDERDRTSRSSW